MSDVIIAEANASIEIVIVKRTIYERKLDPNIRLRDSVILKDGPRAYKVATHWAIVDQNTGEIHHHSLKIETFRHRPGSRTSTGGWYFEVGKSIGLENEDGDEIRVLLTFLRTIFDETLPEENGEYLVIPAGDSTSAESLRRLFRAASGATKVDLLTEVVTAVKSDPQMLLGFVEHSTADPEASRAAAAALNVAGYRSALEQLENLIETDAKESAFQAHLAANPWMFGSEYSQLLDRREWTRGQEQDFMLRRTADDYLEIIEIKTSLQGKPLFQYDQSHDSYYPRSELSKVVGQVMSYLDEIDAQRHTIEAKDRERVHKIRGKIIIGRDGDDNQRTALRSYNGHLHRIEILTFDQLVRIASQVLRYLEQIFEPVALAEVQDEASSGGSADTIAGKMRLSPFNKVIQRDE